MEELTSHARNGLRRSTLSSRPVETSSRLERGAGQWIRWCRNPDFSWGADPETVGAGYRRVNFPIRALSLKDDEAMILNCTRKRLAAYANAPVSIEVIDPASLGLDRVVHIGFFRQKASASLWLKVFFLTAAGRGVMPVIVVS